MAALCPAAPSVAAQGVLEQMQTEVATIAAKTKSAVVTISDHQDNVTQTFNLYSWPLNASVEAQKRAATPKAVTVDRAIGLLQQKTGRLENERSAKLRVYKAGNPADKALFDEIVVLQNRLNEADDGRRDFGGQTTFEALGVKYTNLDYKETGVRGQLKELQKKYAPQHPLIVAKRDELSKLQKRLARGKLLLDLMKNVDPLAANVVGYGYRNGPATKTGSGFSIGDGYIVTTADVLDSMKDPIVTTDSGIRVRAKIVGVDKDLNVGLVQLLAKVDLPALALGDSAKVAVGHFAISVGEQSGQANSVALMLVGGLRTDGVSAGGHFYSSLIQIAGTVGAGISGAPLVNARGEVIGIMAGVPAAPPAPSAIEWSDLLKKESVRAYEAALPEIRAAGGTANGNPYIITPVLPDGEHLDALPKNNAANKNSVLFLGEIPIIAPLFRAENVGGSVRLNWSDVNAAAMGAAPVTSAGFAVPINALKPVLEELKSGKPVARGWIGISPGDDVTTTEKAGVIYANHAVTAEGVYPDSPAFIAGIRPGDALIRLNDAPVRTAADVREASQRLRPGDALKIAYRRAELPVREVTLTITVRPATFKTPLTLPAK